MVLAAGAQTGVVGPAGGRLAPFGAGGGAGCDLPRIHARDPRTRKIRLIAGLEQRQARGKGAHARGVAAELAACAALQADGWTVLGRRLRTPAGEIDIAAERDGLLALVEVKARPALADAAASVGKRQRIRLLAAAEILIAAHPEWGMAGIRFDVIVVDAAGRVRRVVDAFRADE